MTFDSGMTFSPSMRVGTTALVLRRAQHEVTAFPIELLLGETHPHLLRAERHVIVIKRQHRSLPGSLRSFNFRALASTVPARCEWRRSPASPADQSQAPLHWPAASPQAPPENPRRSDSARRRLAPSPPFAPPAACAARRHR